MDSLSALLGGGGNGSGSSGFNGFTSAGTTIDRSRSKDSSSSSTTSTYPDWKMELTMERLKQKVQQTRSYGDLAKNIRLSIVERRSILDHTDKSNLQKSLDVLQQNIKVNSLQSMVERLEMVSRQQGLRFHPGGTGNEWFISSDMFFLELLIDSGGVVQEIKIQHDGKTGQQNCPEIITALQNNDFEDFSAHLSGLVSIYQLNADKNIKSKVFIALQALESDLATIASTYSPELGEGDLIVMKTLLGVVKPRTGGHPLKLTFYISPYEFLDTNTKTALSNDASTIMKKQLGTVATVAVQASSTNKLQMSAIVSVLRADGRSTPRYGTLNTTNSTALPACFTFNLRKPIAVCKQLVDKIHTATTIHSLDLSTTTPILSLLTEVLSKGKLDCRKDRGLFVALPDQLHCYFMTETAQLDGIMVSTISFTLASQVSQIVTFLRQQLVFNTLIGSCIRLGSKRDMDNIVFEVSALSYQNITVSFQHPLEDSLVTLEFDLKDVCHPHCRLHAVLSNGSGMEIIPTLEEHACRVVQRSMSIPVTVRAVIRRWHSIKPSLDPPNPTFDISLGSSQTGPQNPFKSSSSKEPSSCRSESGLQSSGSQHPFIPTMVTNIGLKSTSTSKMSTATPISTSGLTISAVPATTSAGQMDLLSTYMNPLLKSLSAQFQNMPGLHSLNMNPLSTTAFQMLANQIQQQTGKSPTSLMELLDQAAGRSSSSASAKKRKRKSSSNDSPIPILPATGRQATPPSPSVRQQLSIMKSPKRRMSDSSNSDSERGGTTPTARELMMSELGLESPKWNLDITPVPSMETFMASKLLSSFSSAAASNIKQERFEATDHDGLECQFTQPRKQTAATLLKRQRDHLPKRSMSLDSTLHGSNAIISSSPYHSGSMQDATGRQLVPPSLSITPVAAVAASIGNTATVNSILAAMKPGIEIIPLHSNHPITIPNSITVTPIVNKPSSSSSTSSIDKKPTFQKKLSSDEFDILLGKKKRVVEQKRKGNMAADELVRKAVAIDKKPLLTLSQKAAANSALMQLKKPSSPGGIMASSGLTTSRSGPSPNKSSSSSTSLSKIGQGKPSVTTLKSASGSTTTITTTTTKTKVKEKRTFTLTTGSGSSPKSGTKSSSFPNPPPLRPMFDLPAGLPGSLSVRSEPTTPTGTSGNNSQLKGNNNKTGFVQTGTVAKKGGLLAGVIDKLKSQQVVESESAGKKELSRLDYLKASSTITTEMQKVKGGAGGGGNGGNSGTSPGQKVPSPVPTTATASTANPMLVNPEYMVKPGGQGLKLTINKTAMGKEKSGGAGKIGVKRSFSALGTLKPSLTPKIIPKKPKLEAGSVPSPGGSKGQGQGRGSPVLPKPKEQLDLTKKLFQPGAVRSLESGGYDAPKFDSNFQIPKKSRTTTPVPIPVLTPDGVKEFAKDVAVVEKVKETPTAVTPTPIKAVLASPDSPDEPATLVPIPLTPTQIPTSTPESPDPIPNTMLSMEETPRIPTTPDLPPEPEIPVLENSTPSADNERRDDDGRDAPNSPHESTPPVLELQQQVPMSSEPPSKEPPTISASSAVVEMPPPALPPLTPEPSRSVPSPSPSPSPAPAPVASVGSPAPLTSSSGATTSVTSIVHIVHSPQPNSPLPSNVLLRSPLVVQSPHSVHANSPYAIDDDLMDEALIGGSSGTGTGSGAGN